MLAHFALMHEWLTAYNRMNMKARRVPRALVLVAISLCATPALSRCPTGEDRQRGLALTHESPFQSLLYKQTSEGLTEQKLQLRGKKLEAVNAIYVHPLLVSKRINKVGTLRVSYSVGIEDIAELPKRKTWTSSVELFSNERKISNGQETLKFKGMARTEIGNCFYPVWVVHESLTLDGKEPITFEKYFSPQLNLVLRAVRLAPDGKVIADTFFDKIEAPDDL